MYKKIVKKIVRKESRDEALKILSLSDEEYVSRFIRYYNDDNWTACFLHLDRMKDILIEYGKMEKGGDFGGLDQLFTM
jgi:hypothetical protein